MTLLFDCIAFDELDAEKLQAWRRFQAATAHLDQPFLSWEYVAAANAHRGRVEVLVATEKGATVALLPFHRDARTRAVPVAGGMNEFQAVLRDPATTIDLAGWLAAGGLRSLAFDHLVTSDEEFSGEFHVTGPCPYADLSHGFDHYSNELQQRGSRTVRETQRKKRKMCRELGEVRFELSSEDPDVFRALLEWKQEQHKRTGVYDTFSHDSVTRFLEAVWHSRGDGFSGFLCALYAGDNLLATHLGIRTSRVAHMWFPAYSPDFQRNSPGLIMLLDMAEALAAIGVQRLDFGPGPQRYKQSLASGSYDVAIGEVVANPLVRWFRAGTRRAKQTLRESAVADWLKVPTQWVHKQQQRQLFTKSTDKQE